jgi:hypothetical protein
MGRFYCKRCKLDFISHVSWNCVRCNKMDQVITQEDKEKGEKNES